MIALYAVTRALRGVPEVDGWSVHTAGRLSVLHEQVTDASPPVTREAMIEHGRRLARLAERRAVLPIRYDTRVASVAALEELLAEREAAWTRRLALVDGHCELIVHLGTLEDRAAGRPDRSLSGRDYLLQRAEAMHRAEDLRAALVEVLEPQARELRVLPDGRRVAALVPRDRASYLAELLADWAADVGTKIAVTGPWPPFSFCEEPEEPGADGGGESA